MRVAKRAGSGSEWNQRNRGLKPLCGIRNEAKRWWPFRCAQRLFDRYIHRVKLVIARHLLDELAVSSIDSRVFEHDEIAKEIEETALLEDALEYHLQLRQGGRCVPAPSDRAPWLEPFLAGAERPDARLHAIGRDKRRVADK